MGETMAHFNGRMLRNEMITPENACFKMIFHNRSKSTMVVPSSKMTANMLCPNSSI